MKKMKRFIALFVAMAMVFALCACSDSEDVGGNQDAYIDDQLDDTDSDTIMTGNKLESDDMRYVIVYNPRIYNEHEEYDSSYLQTGDFGGQIDVNAYRADGLDGETSKFISVDQSQWLSKLPLDKKLEGNRAEPVGIDYKVGDVKTFYVSPEVEEMVPMNFTCAYAGKYCHVWNAGNLNATQATKLGTEFDTKIYKSVVDSFGQPRFVGESGKINLLLYSMQDSYLGFFYPLDLFTPDELIQIGAGTTDGYNTNHAILHINDQAIRSFGAEKMAYSTLAHELQHLINFSSFFETVNGARMNTWIDEAMSGYIEESLYSGAKEMAGHFEQFNNSSLIRNGQSLYNFNSETSALSFDIGVYGSVYYFAKYLESTAGKDVFSELHDYWRNSYSSTLSVPEALENAVSDSFKKKVNDTISYPKSLTFDNDSEEFMSKLTLKYYLSMLSNSDNIKAFDNINHQSILYDSIVGTEIEGGGRLIFAINGNSFEVPDDADEGLIYIGLDADFKPVTNVLYK